MWRHVYQRLYEGFHYRLRTLAGGRWASHCRPASIGILLTNLCNARCVHCDIWKNKGREESPSVEEWKTVLSDLRRWLGPVEIFFSGGEALLQPYAADLVAHASQVGLAGEVLTHGYWEDQSRIELLALARPWRVTVSLDGIGETHTRIRGRERFWEKTTATIQTLKRARRQNNLTFAIRLKTVIMAQNLDDAPEVARYAAQEGVQVFYQPVEQNYNTPEDPRWFEHSENWPRDPEKAISTVRGLLDLKRSGLPIANSYAQLQAMIPYFRDPDSRRVATQYHCAHEKKPVCNALTSMQLMPNGDVVGCTGMGPLGNFRRAPIREIWEQRPRWWVEGCCLNRRCTPAEKETLGILTFP